ncbi:MAG: DsbA family oxidoreductase, partial [Steroidobacteraceae bacterium]
MRIEIWTDIICPWCGLGRHRLDAALARFEHADKVELVHRSFQLDERAPIGVTESVRTLLERKTGMSDAQIESSVNRVERMAEAEGLRPYIVLENRAGNTSLAHELATWATELGHGKDTWAMLYNAYFGEARSIFDVDVLVALAAELGLDPLEAREVLTSRRYAERIIADAREARALGARGVPFIVIDRHVAIAGAQSADVILGALESAWR